jgi:hypothetical protein
VAVETRAPLVWLGMGLVDLLARAAGEGLQVALVTDTRSRLTEPVRDLLESLRGKWVVRSGDGELYDGLDGRLLDGLGAAFADGPWPGVAEAFLRPGPATCGQLAVSWSMRHKAELGTMLGGSVETALETLGLPGPSGWGPHEPATEPWDKAALTEFARARAPQPTRLTVVSPAPAVLTMTVQRTVHGVEESVTGLVGLGDSSDPASARRLVEAPKVLAALCEYEMPLFGFLLARSGAPDLTHAPRLPVAPMPVGMLIGPPGVRELGIDVDKAQTRFEALAAGRKRLPGLVFPLAPRSQSDVNRLADVLASFDPVKLRRVLGRTVDRVIGASGGL